MGFPILPSHARTIRHRLPFLLCLATTSMLSACGGSGGVNSTPAPTPPASGDSGSGASGGGTTISTNATLPLTVSETFEAASAKIIATVDKGTGAASEVTLPSRASFATVSIAYDAATDSYTFADEASARTFAPADATSSDGAFKYYGKTVGTSVESLKLFKSATANSRLALTYVTYGIWSTSQDGFATNHFLSRFATTGVQTVASTMPRTGSATYTGIADGAAAIGGHAYRLVGSTGTLTADFATGVVKTTLTLNGNADVSSDTPGTTALGTLEGLAQIGFGTSKYTGTIKGMGLDGSIGGGFYGPRAAETGYAFSAAGGDDAAVGVFVGKKP